MITIFDTLAEACGLQVKATELRFEHNGEWHRIDIRGMTCEEVEKAKQEIINKTKTAS